MIALPNTVKAWLSPNFQTVLKGELERTAAHLLPLQQAMTQGSALGVQPFSVSLLASVDRGEALFVKVGVFFTSIVAGCNCADAPSPMDENTEYCQLGLSIDKATADTRVELYD